MKKKKKRRHTKFEKVLMNKKNRETDFYALFVFIPKDHLAEKLVRFQE